MATRPALFRQEAIDFLRQRNSWGEVVALQPLSSTILGWTLAGLVAIIVCFLSIAQYARKETVTGYLTPAAGTAKIFAPQQGTIKEIYVKEGQQVEKEQPLLAVETSQIAASDRAAVAVPRTSATTRRMRFLRRLRRSAGEYFFSGGSSEYTEAPVSGCEEDTFSSAMFIFLANIA